MVPVYTFCCCVPPDELDELILIALEGLLDNLETDLVELPKLALEARRVIPSELGGPLLPSREGVYPLLVLFCVGVVDNEEPGLTLGTDSRELEETPLSCLRGVLFL